MFCLVLRHFPSSFSLMPELSTEKQSIPMPHFSLSGSEDMASVCLFSPTLPSSFWNFPGPAIPLIQVHKRAKCVPIAGPSPRLLSVLRSSPTATVHLANSHSLPLLGSPKRNQIPSVILHSSTRFISSLHVLQLNITCSMFTYCHSLPLDYRLYKVRGKVMFLVEPQYLAQGLEHSRQIRNA